MADSAPAGVFCIPGRPGLGLVEPDIVELKVFGSFADCKESRALFHLLADW
ncbi:MAG: hypothetical protein K6E40_01165 [Desulfovibrio sp.]|nr:hypothetical protein [Desulfovibrio sp.]